VSLDNGWSNKVNDFYDKFYPRQINETAHELFLRQYEQKKHILSEYIIAMTPRSGSSWLTELMASTNVAGNPGEFFNHRLIEGSINYYNCVNLEDYLKCLKGDQSSPNGVFGIEVTMDQLNLVLKGCSFDKLFSDTTKFIYLTRRDFVAQGISLYTAIETGRFHSYQTNLPAKKPKYDENGIKKWILHILNQERAWEHFFMEKKIHPLRIYYENLVENTSAVITEMLDYLNISDGRTIVLPTETKHTKLSDSTKNDFYSLFSENKSFIKHCNQFRASSYNRVFRPFSWNLNRLNWLLPGYSRVDTAP
jgi:trehalose 2-sulfotransferase